MTQDEFNLTIGRLDRVLSEMHSYSKDINLDIQNRQTLKHHAEDMIGLGEKIIKRLEGTDGTPQPEL